MQLFDSLFMSSALPRPANNDCIILFVIGGITSAEVKQIRETMAKYKATQQVSYKFSYFNSVTYIIFIQGTGWNHIITDTHGQCKKILHQTIMIN